MEQQYIAIYILQFVIFGGVGLILKLVGKGTTLYVPAWLLLVMLVPGLGIIVGIYKLIRYTLR